MKKFTPKLLWALLLIASNLYAQPNFSAAFSPSTIGPGSSSYLTFTITNGTGSPVENLAFSNTLPAGVVLGNPANPIFNSANGTLVAPNGGSTISLTNGKMGVGEIITIRVTVVGTSVGLHTNVSGDLTYSAGNSGTASANLTVDGNSPGFSSSFSPAQIKSNKTSTLTFTVDNSANSSQSFNPFVNVNLPSGMKVANPTNFTNSCSWLFPNSPVSPGQQVFTANGSPIPAGSSCTFSMDVETLGIGGFIVNGTLSSYSGDSGFSNSELVVEENIENGILFESNFLNNPAKPGDVIPLEFKIKNLDRSDALTGLTFSSDLDATLSGLVAVGLPISNSCGAGSSLTGTSVLTMTGGSLAAGEECTFSVNVQIPAIASAGSYSNTTSTISGQKAGSPVTGPSTSDDLIIRQLPTLSKTLTSVSPAFPGSTVTYEYTLTNHDPTNALSDGLFIDDFNGFATSVSGGATIPSSNFCGSGSMIFFNSNENTFNFYNLSLPAGGSCTFQVSFEVPSNALGNTYPSQISSFSGTVDSETLQGQLVANEDLIVGHTPRITKTLSKVSALPGEIISVEYTISADESSASSFTNVSFTDDFDSFIPGTSVIGLPQNDICGSGSTLAGTSTLNLTGGSLAPGGSCNFTVTFEVPATTAVGSYSSSTSDLTGMAGTASFTSIGASSSLNIVGLKMTKTFSENPTISGLPITINYSLENLNSTDDITFLLFNDNLDESLKNLTITSINTSTGCGSGSFTGTSILQGNNIQIAAGTPCLFSANAQIPNNAEAGFYPTVLQNVTYTVDGGATGSKDHIQLIEDPLEVATPISFTKNFQKQQVIPGDTVALEFTLTNSNTDFNITGISFSDDLNAMLAGSYAIGITPTLNDVCGAGSSLSGTNTISFSNGALAAGGSCSFSVDIVIDDTYQVEQITNRTSALAYTINSNTFTLPPVEDDLSITDTRRVVFSKSFLNKSLNTGETTTLTFKIDNSENSNTASSLAFTDNLPEGMVVSSIPNITNGCPTGVVNATSESSFISFTGGSVGAETICSISVDVKVDKSGYLVNDPGSLSSTTGSSIGAKDSVQVTLLPPSSFTASTVSATEIALSATANATNSDSILVVFNTVNTFGTPAGHLSTGDPVAGGGEVLFKGLATNLPNHTGLDQSKVYYYQVWSLGYDLYSSSALMARDTTCVSNAAVFGIEASDNLLCTTESLKLGVSNALDNTTYEWQVKMGSGGFVDLSSGGIYSNTETDTLSISSVSLLENGNIYRCIVFSKCGTDTTSEYTLTVYGNPLITLHPKDSSLCAGDEAKFFVTASGPGLTYQWQKKAVGGSFTDISTGGTSSTLTLTGIASSEDSTFYRCVVTGTCGVSISNPALLRVPERPVLTAGAVTNPSTCLGADGSIAFTSTNLPDGSYSLNYTGTGSPKSVTVSSNAFSLSGLSAGAYSGFSITRLGCTGTEPASKTLTDPPTPTITAGAVTNPSTCLGTDGSIAFTSTNLPDGSYSLSYTGTGSPKSVTVSSNTFSLTGLSAGAYSGFSVTRLGCTGTEPASKTLTDPPTPTITAGAVTNPSTCLGTDGSIAFTSTNLPDGSYSLSYTGTGSPKSVTVSSNTFSLTGLSAGAYSGFSVTRLGCTGTEPASKTLTDPPTPTITAGAVTNPSTCLGTDGSIAFTSTNLPDGSYSLNYTGTGSPKSVTVSSNAFSLSGLSAGAYSGFSVTRLGCTGTEPASKILTDPPTPTITAGAVTNPSTCLGTDGSIAYTSTNLPDGSYSLSYTGTGSPKSVTIRNNSFVLIGLGAGSYSNFSLSHLGCTALNNVTKELTDPVFQVSASNTGPYQEGDIIQLMVSQGLNFDWTGPNGFSSSLQNPAIPSSKIQNAGVYSVTVSNSLNCVSTATTSVVVSCSSQGMSYYLAYSGENPELIAPLAQDMQVQVSDRLMTVIAVSNCDVPLIESVKLQLSGTSNVQYRIDNNMPFSLYSINEAVGGDRLFVDRHTFIARGYDQNDAMGNVVAGPDVVGFNIVGGNRQISSPTTSKNKVCIGESINISAIPTGDFEVGNNYKAYLSDKDGYFWNSILIGTSNDPSNIACQIPNYVAGGSKYKVMVISSAPVVSSLASIASIEIISADLTLMSPNDDVSGDARTFEAKNKIKSTHMINTGSNVTYRAERSIELKPGANIKGGSVFKASIGGVCSNDL